MNLYNLVKKVSLIVNDTFLESEIVSVLNEGVQEIAGGMQSTLGSWLTPPLPELFTIATVETDSEDAAYTTYSGIKTLISSGDTLVFTYNDTELSISITGDYSTLQTDINTALITNSFTSADVIVSWSDNDLILTCSGTDLSSDTIIGGTYTDTDTSNTTTPTDIPYIAPLPYVSMPTTFQRDLQFASQSNGAELDIANSFIDFAENAPLLNRSGSVYEVSEQGGNLYYQNIPNSPETLTVHFYRYPVNMTTNTDEPDGIPKHLHRGLLVNYAAWKLYELIEDGLETPGVNTQRYMSLFQASLRTLELTILDDLRGFNLLFDS